MTSTNKFFSPVVNQSLIKAGTIIAVSVVIYLAVSHVTGILSRGTTPDLCNLITPFKGVAIDHDCESNNERLEQIFSNLKLVPESREQPTHTDRQSMNNTSQEAFNLEGNWTFSGYNRGTLVYAEVELRNNDSYLSTGKMLFDNREFPFNEGGIYRLDPQRMILYFVDGETIRSIYLLENTKMNSFYGFNPNSVESYTFKRLTS